MSDAGAGAGAGADFQPTAAPNARAVFPNLLDQIDDPVDQFWADVAYDGNATRNLLAERFGASIEFLILPPKNVTFSTYMSQDPTVRDYQIAHIQANGLLSWQKASCYNQRSRIETQIGRWKAVIGPKLKARKKQKPILASTCTTV